MQYSIPLSALALRTPFTFSQTTSSGFSSSMALRISTHRLDRVPGENPKRFPARLTS
nr:MAG TPA: hypothetical protein [Caudoviricetes sp.]DAY05066.1 MAG TPA: hypothetical protein [Caudoviricetes sp.]